MKKFWTIAICAMLLGAVAFAAVGCNKGAGDTINVFSREDGSGTRSAFTELTGVLVECSEQIRMVSINTESICTSPCFTGWDTSAAAAALGAEPMPASLE